MPDITRIANVIQPSVFTAYTIQRTMELSELIRSGIAINSPMFNTLAAGPNTLINMPFWEDLTGEPEVMNDKDKTIPGGIYANKDVARKMAWTKSYGANALAALLSGDDPMGAIAELFAEYWQRQYQDMLLSMLDGVFASATMADKIKDISGKAGDAGLINGKTILDALQVMGDAKDAIAAMMMNSYVETELAKQDLIEYIQQSEGEPRLPFFMNKRVIVDDAMPFDTDTGVGVIYMFGNGAVAWGNGNHPSILQTEIVREGMSLAGEDVLVNRRLPILHPRGIKWTEAAVAGVYPTKEELANGANWQRVFEPKAIRIVKFVFRTA